MFELHGWGETAERLSALARRGQWQEMPQWIDEEMLATLAVVAPEAELARALRDRYQGLADRVTPYPPFRPGERGSFWRSLATDFR